MTEKEGKGKLGDILKTVVSTGAAAASMGGETMKGLIEDARAAKSELVASAKAEVKGWLDRIDVRKEIDRVLADYDVEVNAKISFKKKPGKGPRDDA